MRHRLGLANAIVQFNLGANWKMPKPNILMQGNVDFISKPRFDFFMLSGTFRDCLGSNPKLSTKNRVKMRCPKWYLMVFEHLFTTF